MAQTLMTRCPDPLDPTSWTEYWYDDETDSLITRYVQDVEEILKSNQADQNETMNQRHKSEVANKVASIPFTVILKWKYELGVDVFNQDHMPKVLALLNDPEYKHLRTRGGKI